tara:strand:+ start:1932 stop:2357 length:426 start_codon:yes stop_codon:yes gene_type:complete
MDSKKRGRSAVSGLTGGSSVVSGPNRKGSAGGPVSRTKRAKRIVEQAKSSGKTAIRETSQAKRNTAKAKHNTKIAADPDNIGRLSPSERTPNRSVSSRIEAVKAKMKKRSIDASLVGGQKGKKLVLAGDMKKKYPVQGKKR